MPRIPPIAAKSDMAPEDNHVFDQVMGVFGRIRGPFSMLLHSPKLAERLLPMVPFAREGTIVEPQLRQIAVLTAVREREAHYVWAAQVDASRRSLHCEYPFNIGVGGMGAWSAARPIGRASIGGDYPPIDV